MKRLSKKFRSSAIAAIGAALVSAAPPARAQTGEPIGILIAAGDITGCHHSGPAFGAMADAIDSIVSGAGGLPVGVLIPGDVAYGDYRNKRLVAGSYEKCFDAFIRTWGRHKQRLIPVPGNHDYTDDTSDRTVRAARYKAYFRDHVAQLAASGGQPLPAPDNALSFTTRFPAGADDGWLIAGLDVYQNAGNLPHWLKSRLPGPRPRCVLAFTHPFLNSSGLHGKGRTSGNKSMRAIMAALYSAGATVLVSGHDHDLEQFRKQNAVGKPDPVRGVRTFVAGTGGAVLYRVRLDKTGVPVRRHPLSQKFANTSRGYLKLTLYRDGYKWSFINVVGPGVELPVGGEACNRGPS